MVGRINLEHAKFKKKRNTQTYSGLLCKDMQRLLTALLFTFNSRFSHSIHCISLKCTIIFIQNFFLVKIKILIFLVLCFFIIEDNDATNGDEDGIGPDLLSDTPPVPPRRRERKRHTPPRPVSNGLPPTPKVHMGACFSKAKENFN